MKRAAPYLALIPLLAFATACSHSPDEAVGDASRIAPMGTEIAEAPILDERDTWPRIENETDLEQLDQLRAGWVRAFRSGDAEAVDFVFGRDAVMADLATLVGESRARPDVFFDLYDAEFGISNPDPIEYGNWGSYYADYVLALTPRDGGDPIEDRGEFMVRLRRTTDGPFEVVQGPRIGEVAPEFALNLMDGSGSVRLSDLRDKATVLVFGSFT